MFKVGDQIYIKKYFGDTLKADTSKIYTIRYLVSRNGNIEATLDNGKRHYLIENDTVFGEKVETGYFCCF